jgi:hypothetical protein
MTNLQLSPSEQALKDRLAAMNDSLRTAEGNSSWLSGEVRAVVAWHFGRARQVTQGLDCQFGTFSEAELPTVERLIGEAEACVTSGVGVITMNEPKQTTA